MPVPDFQSMMLPALAFIAEGRERASRDVRSRLAKEFSLSDSELGEMLPSGRQTRFANRVAWALVHLRQAGALESAGRGIYRATDRGREILAGKPKRVDLKLLNRYPEFREFRGLGAHAGTETDEGAASTAAANGAAATPRELLESSYKTLRAAIEQELLAQLGAVEPGHFEEIVVELLVRMGYGGSLADAGKAIGRSGDGGLDGIIKEDRLGLDVVYVQAKRWKDPVGRPLVQAFAGSLEGVRARKGVFITTSRFTEDAAEYVRHIEKRIVLIDGAKLAGLMFDFNLGVAVVGAYEVKRLDEDYFAGE